MKNNNPSNYDNALNYDLTKVTEKDFYDDFNNDKNIIHNLVIKKRLTNEEEKIIMDNFKVLFILIRRLMIKAVGDFKKGDLEPMAKLQSLLKTF